MPHSALVGEQPASYNDELVYRGLTFPSTKRLSRPSHVSHDNRAPGMIIGSSFAIFFVIIITGSRLWVRKYRLRAFGADDVVIIPAAISCVAYLALAIASESAGCMGKHIFNCTYAEVALYLTVSELHS